MADVEAVPSFKKRTNKSTHMRKRPASPPAEDPVSASESDYTDDEGGARVKRRRKNGVAVKSSGPARPQDLSKSTKYSADRSTTFTANDSATKTSNWSVSDAAAAAAQKSNTPQAGSKDASATENDGNYKGTSTYSSFIQKNPHARESIATKQVGPVKAASNVRTITVTDFAPDVCKDYKQTGFCGFGDSCKFLHAREDYKQGWQLDKEWEKVGSKKSKSQSKPEDDMDDEEKLLATIPFKCIICKEDYKNPIVTRCGHYFCQKCAMGRYMKEKKKSCANCGADTSGTFNVGKKLKDLLARKTKREEEREQKDAEKEA